MRFVYLSLLVAAALGAAGDPYCPRYPESVRTEIEASLSLDREADFYARMVRKAGVPNRHAAQRLAESGSFIDQLVAKKMNADGVPPAPRSSDAEFLRRVSLDLTGHRKIKRGTLAYLLASPNWPVSTTVMFGAEAYLEAPSLPWIFSGAHIRLLPT